MHETGLIGSLRWWYEVIARGMGCRVTDPTTPDEKQRGRFDTKAYEEARHSGRTTEQALQAGLKTLCPVSYLFGATGWARLFRLEVVGTPERVPLHFTSAANLNWLQRVFGGEQASLKGLEVTFDEVCLRITARGHDSEYALGQLAVIIRFAQDYAALGARPQYGFGQFEVRRWLDGMDHQSLQQGLQALSHKSREMRWMEQGKGSATVYDLRNFFSIDYQVSLSDLYQVLPSDSQQRGADKTAPPYIPCAFDLRYKGKVDEKRGYFVGMRQWLKEKKNWAEADIDGLMGPSGKKGRPVLENERAAGLVYFGMPYLLKEELYRLRVFGFAPPAVLTPETLVNLCTEYVNAAVRGKPTGETLGKYLVLRVTERASTTGEGKPKDGG